MLFGRKKSIASSSKCVLNNVDLQFSVRITIISEHCDCQHTSHTHSLYFHVVNGKIPLKTCCSVRSDAKEFRALRSCSIRIIQKVTQIYNTFYALLKKALLLFDDSFSVSGHRLFRHTRAHMQIYIILYTIPKQPSIFKYTNYTFSLCYCGLLS